MRNISKRGCWFVGMRDMTFGHYYVMEMRGPKYEFEKWDHVISVSRYLDKVKMKMKLNIAFRARHLKQQADKVARWKPK